MSQQQYKLKEPLRVGGLADPKYQDLSYREVKQGYRVIGGDKGDIHFDGYTLDDSVPMTELYKPVLVSGLELTEAEAFQIAVEVLAEAVDAVGLEAVEHS